jgi:site-specific DNA-methyltransferase (adenine-specific)
MYEPCFYGWFKKSSFTAGRDQVEVWDFNKPTSSPYHPTMKPIELAALGIQNSSSDGEAVLDLFGGSGTTLLASEQLGRRCLMVELEPHYVDVILARWEKATKAKAEKL